MLHFDFTLVIAAAAALIGLLWFVLNYLRICAFVRTTGSIVKYVAQESDNGLTLWRMVIEFKDRDENSHRVNTSTAYFPRPVEPIGSPVQIKYPPSQPANADVFEDNQVWFVPMVLVLGGVAGVLYQLVTNN